MYVFRICSNGMFVLCTIYLSYIYPNQEVSMILCTLLKRAEVIPITELFIKVAYLGGV